MLKKASKAILLFGVLASIALNVRFYYMWKSAHNDTFEIIESHYIENEELLLLLQNEEYEKAEESLQSYVKTMGLVVAICAIEQCKID